MKKEKGLYNSEIKAETIFRKKDLILSKRFSCYSKDLMNTLLVKDWYSISEAEYIIKKYLNKGGK